MMKKLLVHIGHNHPQALVFYLVFLRKGMNNSRKKTADDIYRDILRKDTSGIISPIYEDADKIVTELCKVSLKLNE